MSYWKDKVVLLTGASSGIGRELALEVARRGAIVGLAARRQNLLEELSSEIESAGGKSVVLHVDVRDAAATRQIADQLRQEFGRIDILIANAGMGGASHAVKLQPELVADVINVNLLGAVNSVAAVLPEMAARHEGQLVAISSLSAYRGLAKSAAYCSSKAALSSFFESVRIDLLNSGVKVSIIHPGFIQTPLTSGRERKMPYLMEVDIAVKQIMKAIERQKTSYSFPWQLASVVRLGMIMPNFMYDWLAARNSFRE